MKFDFIYPAATKAEKDVTVSIMYKIHIIPHKLNKNCNSQIAITSWTLLTILLMAVWEPCHFALFTYAYKPSWVSHIKAYGGAFINTLTIPI